MIERVSLKVTGLCRGDRVLFIELELTVGEDG